VVASRMMRVPARRLAVLAVALALPAGCAPTRSSASRASAGMAAAPSDLVGVIVAARRVPPGAEAARDAILARLGMALPPGAAPPLVEFIVRAGDGRTFSVVQAAGPALRPGARVAMLEGPRPTLRPAATEVAAAPAK